MALGLSALLTSSCVHSSWQGLQGGGLVHHLLASGGNVETREYVQVVVLLRDDVGTPAPGP